jgi:hypothetical protein
VGFTRNEGIEEAIFEFKPERIEKWSGYIEIDCMAAADSCCSPTQAPASAF